MTTLSLRRLPPFVALLCLGLVAGATFSIWRGYDPRGLPAAAYIAMHQTTVRGLNVLMPVLGLVSIIFMAVSAYLARRNRTALVLLLGALACVVGAGVITRFINQPINAEILTWTIAAPPANWETLRDTWWTWHIVRTLLSVSGFVLLIGAVLAS